MIPRPLLHLSRLIKLILLHHHSPPGTNMGLPCGSPHILDTVRILEDINYFLKRLARGFREHEERVNQHSQAEDAEYEISLPLDIDKGGRHEVAESEVEGPVRRGSESDSLASDAERIELWGIDPRDGSPSWRVRGNEEVAASDDSFGC